MKSANKLVILCILFALYFCGCEDKAKSHICMKDPYFVDVSYDPIPKHREIQLPEEIGIKSIKVLDSLIIIGHSDHWSIYDKKTNKIGDYLSIGDGPNDFLYLLPCSNAAFVMLNDSLTALIPDIPHQKILALNLQKCKDGCENNLRTIITDPNIDNRSWDMTICDTNSYLIARPHPDFKGFYRNLMKNGSREIISSTSQLDSIKVLDSEHLNLLSKVTRYDATADMFVEAMGYLNQINIYSRDGTYGKTICVGSDLDNILDKEGEFVTNRKEAYITATAWPKGFGTAYSGVSDKDRKTDENLTTDMQFFDWQGNPKYRFRLPFYVLAFDIDFDKRILYVVDERKDILRSYDATPIIDKLNGM